MCVSVEMALGVAIYKERWVDASMRGKLEGSGMIDERLIDKFGCRRP